jgi:hypothetical protein
LNGEQSFKDGISGYAAIIGFDQMGQLFVLRDNKAPLYMSYIVELDSYVMCTDPHHCNELTKMLCEFNSIKAPKVSTPMMLADYTKHVFQLNGEVQSIEFPKFDNRMSYSSTAGIYRSLGSAGVAGYTGGSYTGNGRSTYVSHYPSIPSTPSTPAASGVPDPEVEDVLTESEQKQLDKFRKESSERSKKNSRKQTKPWKDSDLGY